MNKLLAGIRFVVRDLKSDGWRSIITVINLTVFISCYFCLASLAEAGFKFGSQTVDPGHLMIISHNVFDLTDSRITEKDFEPARELLPSPVASVSPLIIKHINVEGYLLQVRGAPLEDFETVHGLTLLEGAWPTGSHEVVIGEGTVALTNWQIGQTLRIYGVDFTISGITRSSGTKFSSIWMTLENAEQLFNTRGVYQFAWIVLTPDANPQAVLDQLNADPRLAGKFDVYFADQLYESYSKALNDIKEISMMLVIFALICVMLGVYGSTNLTLTERSRELTILRAVGFGSNAIRMVLTMRTFVQVIASFLLAWLISFIAIEWFQTIRPIVIHSVPLPVVISLNILAVGGCLSILFAWIGVWLPTRHLRNSSVASMIQR